MGPLLSAAANGHTNIFIYLLQSMFPSPSPNFNPLSTIITDKGLSALHLAALGGHVDTCRWLLQHGSANPSLNADSHYTPLHAAAASTSPQTLDLFLSIPTLPIDPQLSASTASLPKLPDGDLGLRVPHSTSNWTPLFFAVASGSAQLASTLLSRKANPNIVISDGQTLMHVAARSGSTECLMLVAQAGVPVDQPDSHGITPLGLAAAEGHLAIVEILVSQGHADISRITDSGTTILHFAAFHGQREVVQLLVKQGGIDISRAVDHNGNSALHAAAAGGHYECCALILQQFGSNEEIFAFVNAGNKYGFSALFYAAGGNFADSDIDESNLLVTCQLLVENGGADVSLQSLQQKTALEFAAKYGRISVIQYLLSKGANPNIQNIFMRTPIFYACEMIDSVTKIPNTAKDGVWGWCMALQWKRNLKIPDEREEAKQIRTQKRLEAIDILVAAGADLQHVDHHHDVLISFCVKYLYFSAARHLATRYNVSFNVVIQDGDNDNESEAGATPLLFTLVEYAQKPKQKAKVVELLEIVLANQLATPNITNFASQTPLHIAAKHSDSDICRLLLIYGATPSVNDINGLSPLAIAHTADCAITLLTHGADINHIEIPKTGERPSLVHLMLRKLTSERIDPTTSLQSHSITLIDYILNTTPARIDVSFTIRTGHFPIREICEGFYPLHLAAHLNLPIELTALAKHMAARGVHVDSVVDAKGYTALAVAADACSVECIRALLHLRQPASSALEAAQHVVAGTSHTVAAHVDTVVMASAAHISITDDNNMTSTRINQTRRQVELLQRVAGTPVTPLWLAIFRGHSRAIAALISQGADVDFEVNGITVVQYAAMQDDRELLRLLGDADKVTEERCMKVGATGVCAYEAAGEAIRRVMEVEWARLRRNTGGSPAKVKAKIGGRGGRVGATSLVRTNSGSSATGAGARTGNETGFTFSFGSSVATVQSRNQTPTQDPGNGFSFSFGK
ncbi:hypothetical protein HK096_004385 [Nowakowskiella sp. JEL0078]|nr:hypothetical protein HK096_004385 [Nowakowskiella sp. JEL0078]